MSEPNFKCKVCGERFYIKPSKLKKRKYCSDKCMSKDYKIKMTGKANPNYRNIEKICPVCENSFINYRKDTKYCSLRCRDIAIWGTIEIRKQRRLLKIQIKKEIRQKNRLAKPMNGPSCRIYYFTCIDCGEILIRKGHSFIKRCAICNKKQNKINLRNLSKSQNRKVELTCLNCGIKFKVPPSYSDHKFCSHKCKAQGKFNANYKGGVTPINSKLRKSEQYIQWRKAVFERDNYTCINCNQHGGDLHADHIKPFAVFPELRYDINNGRTLCKKCHMKTDTYLRFRKREYYEK